LEVPVQLAWEVKVAGDPLNKLTDVQMLDLEKCPRYATRAVCKSNSSHCILGQNRGYTCSCRKGYHGNPYIPGDSGCQGTVFLPAGGFLSYAQSDLGVHSCSIYVLYI
jgi:hypothetical protein